MTKLLVYCCIEQIAGLSVIFWTLTRVAPTQQDITHSRGCDTSCSLDVMHCTLPLTLESRLLSDMLEEESGLPGEEESTCKGPSCLTLTSDGVCKGAAYAESRR